MKRILLKGFKKSKDARSSHLRVEHKGGVFSQIDTDSDDESFQPVLPALVYNESFQGCAMVVLHDFNLEVGDVCKIQVGELAPIEGEVAWKDIIDKHVIKIGIKFKE